jgi:hypothetical protein
MDVSRAEIAFTLRTTTLLGDFEYNISKKKLKLN